MVVVAACAGWGIRSASAAGPTPIDLSGLPKPPAEIRDLIESGHVTFESGQRIESDVAGEQPQLSAETRFRIEYDYTSRTSWTLSQGGRRLEVRVSFHRVAWKPRHVVWFRRRPASEQFWSNPLVLHELDHVRISTDRPMEAKFTRSLREPPLLVYPVSDSERVNQRFVDRCVDGHVERIFTEITDLISIRYRELDRVTDHGRRAVPVDSPLRQLLGADGQAADDSAR